MDLQALITNGPYTWSLHLLQRRTLARLLLLTFYFVVPTLWTVAQTRTTDHSVTGLLLDASSGQVFGAEVVLLDHAGKEVAKTETDHSGLFFFDTLAHGKYLLRIHALGFRDVTFDLTIGDKPIPTLRFTLAIAPLNEVVNVPGGDAAPQVETEAAQNQNTNAMTRDALDRVPVFDQDYVTLLSRFLSEDSIGTNGVSLVVNGIGANGPGVSASAVQEVKINQNPYAAQFARPGRARLEIVTKEGTPNLHGSINFLTRNSVFDARNYFAATKPPESRYYTEGSVTGPLGHNPKNTFLVSLEEDEDNLESIVHALGPNGSFIDDNVPTPKHHFFSSVRAFHDLANGSQFWIGYSYEQETLRNQGVGGIVLRESGFTSRSFEHEVNVGYRAMLSSHWVNQLRMLVGHQDEPTVSNLASPQIIVEGFFTGGGTQGDLRRTEAHFQGTDFLTFAKGRQVIIFGIETPDLSRRGADDFTSQQGTYTFPDITAYKNSAPASFRIQTGNGHLVFWERSVAAYFEDTLRIRPSLSVSVGLRYYFQDYFHDDSNNLAPRASVAFAPSAKSKTVFRGGAGVFFDRSGNRPIADLLHFDGKHLTRLFLPVDTGEPVPFPVTPADLVAVPESLVVLDPRLRIPYILQFSFGVERQITAKSTLSVTYVGNRGIHLFRSIDANAPRTPDYLQRPEGSLGQVRSIQSEGYQKGNSVEVTFRGKPTKYLSGQAQYILSKTYNNTTGIPYFVGNSNFPALDWSRSSNDRRHKFDLLGAFSPIELLSFGFALQAYSGKPVNVITGADANGDGIFNDRPNGGLDPRNSLHGPGYLNLDANVERDFLFTRDKKGGPTLTVAFNLFNLLNHPNFVTYNGVIGPDPANPIPSFGRPSAAEPGRRFQINLQFKF
jgi:carboxypeptidase family protein